MTDDLDNSASLEQEIEYTPTDWSYVPCKFTCGIAGSGKTYSVKQQYEAEPGLGILAATTGIAGVNLGTTTLNALLGYFDTKSLMDKYVQNHLTTKLHKLALTAKWIAIDEVSMMEGMQLDIIYSACQASNALGGARRIGLHLIGDFAQLPPVSGKWAFEANCWHRFAESTERLTKIWRQSQPEFLNALNLTRSGSGDAAAQVLTQAGLKWNTEVSMNFPGTTILPVNENIDAYNMSALFARPGEMFEVSSRRWGKQRPEWGPNKKGIWGIPPKSSFKIGAYVMVMANSKRGETPDYANGDCGFIREYDPDKGIFRIDLVRSEKTVELGKLVRSVIVTEEPEGWPIEAERLPPGYRAKYHCTEMGDYVLGQIEYFPVRLAYASSVHRSQGLSLDRVQVDIRHWFFGEPAMEYVALSRCRTLEGLRIVGQPEKFVKHCTVDPKVREWL